MNLIIALLVGSFVGWLASKLAGRDEGFIINIFIGVIGSFIGSFLSVVITGSNRAYLDFSWSGLLWSLVGALILITILNAVRGKSPSS